MPVFPRKEPREMLAYDLVGFVSYCAARTCVPIDDQTAWIEHINRIIQRIPDHLAKDPLAFQRSFLRRCVRCYIAQNHGIACGKTGSIGHRMQDRTCKEPAAILAQQPDLALRASFKARFLQKPGRNTCAAILIAE